MTDLNDMARMRDEYLARRDEFGPSAAARHKQVRKIRVTTAEQRKREREQPTAKPAAEQRRDDQIAALYRLWAHLPRVFRRVKVWHAGYSSVEEAERCSAAEANVITSEIQNSDLHAPVLDMDIPCALVPSSTPGHFHLYIEKPMTWRTYKRLLKALGRAGILEDGFVQASLSRGYTSVRVPWVKKYVG
jgi:tryptophan 2,3-dioxygenase